MKKQEPKQPKEVSRKKLAKKWASLHDVWLAKRAEVYKAQEKLAKALQNLDVAQLALWDEINKTEGEGKMMSIEGEGNKRELVVFK